MNANIPAKLDLLVIGAGSGGVRAARMAASAGASVGIVESGPLGGTCVNLGCIPKKLFYYGAGFSHQFADAAHYGWNTTAPSFNWQQLVGAKNTEITRLNGIYRQLLETPGAQIIVGRAQLLGEKRVAVADQVIEAERILIATGSRPVRPDFPGAEWTAISDDLFHMPELPERIAVLGGGYIALEFAGIFKGMGCEVDLLYRRKPLLRGMDMQVRQFVTDCIADQGVRLHLRTEAVQLERAGGELKLTCRQGDETRQLTADLVLAATGRAPSTEGLGLKKAGVEVDEKGAIVVDDEWQTSASGIYALGDVIGTAQLTPVAIAQAMNFYHRYYGEKAAAQALDYGNVTTAVFCHPSVGSVGMTEDEALDACGDLRVYTSSFRPLHNTITAKAERVLAKLIVNAANDRVVGAHMVGEGAGEIIQCLALGVANQLTKADFDRTMAVHPTTAEEFVTMSSWRPGEAAYTGEQPA